MRYSSPLPAFIFVISTILLYFLIYRCLFPFLLQICELFLGFGELLHELIVVDEGGKDECTDHLPCLDVAVVMEADNPAAFAELEAALEELVLPLGIDACQDHRYCDTCCAVARDVASVVAKAFLCLRD